jgi:hypothetical protein
VWGLIYEVETHAVTCVALGGNELVTETGKYLTIRKRAADRSLTVKAEIWDAGSYPRHALSR